MSRGTCVPITRTTALREMWISSSVGAAEMELFQYHSPNTKLMCRECRHDGPWQASSGNSVQSGGKGGPATCLSLPCSSYQALIWWLFSSYLVARRIAKVERE